MIEKTEFNKELKILVINNETKRMPDLVSMLSPHQTEIVHVDELTPEAYNDHDLVVLSGGTREKANTPQVFDSEIQLIKNLIDEGVPIIAICLGFQITMRALEQRMHDFEDKFVELPSVRSGLIEIMIIDENHPLTQGVSEIVVFENHRRAITETPYPFIPLGISPDGVEIAWHENGILGMQFHPEADNSQNSQGKLIFDNFMTMLLK